MQWIGELWRRFTFFFRRGQFQRELKEEMDDHVRMKVGDLSKEGVPSDEAQCEAGREFGNALLLREKSRDAWGFRWLETLLQDLRYGVRQMRRNPGFAMAAIITLALGIGANTAIFSLVDAALLKTLPVRKPGQLVEIKNANPTFGAYNGFAYPAFKEFRDHNRVFSGVLSFANLDFPVDVEVNGQGAVAKGQVVSGDYFSTLGVPVIVGRTIQPYDEKSANPVAVISYEYWRERFALDPAVVGKHILINNSPFTIVGVTPPDFFGLEPGEPIDVSVPLTNMAQLVPGVTIAGSNILTAPFRNWLITMGRLRPGVTKQQALANLQPVFRQTVREAVAGLVGTPFDSPGIRRLLLKNKLRLDSGSKGLAALREKYSKPLWILMAITGLLLLVSCANVANLMLARASARQKEIAVRLTVGAGRRRLLRQFLTESVVLAACGGALGLIVAFWACRSLLVLMSHADAPFSVSVGPDPAVLGFTLLVSVITALLFGLAPAWRAADVKVESTRSFGGSGSRSTLGKMLIVLQIAVSLVIMAGAGLLVRTLEDLKGLYPGFNKENVLLFSIDPGMIGYEGYHVIPLDKSLLARIDRIPGVRSATLSFISPLAGLGEIIPKVDGSAPQATKATAPVGVNEVGPNYFATLQTPVLSGRDFTPADRAGAPKVAIINEAMARDYFGETNPMGRHVSVADWNGDRSWRTIVGLVKDVKVSDLRESSTPVIYLPLFQSVEGAVTFEIRTAMAPRNAITAVLQAVKATESRLPVHDVKTLNEQVNDSLIQERLVASLSSLFGALALVLAGVGLYGVITYRVASRTHEFGIRMALGAQKSSVLRLVLGQGMILGMLGVGIGIACALGLNRFLSSMIYGVKPTDPLTLIAVSLILVCVALLACYIPARRATKVDPMVALRYE